MTAVPAPKRQRPPESAGEVDTLVGMLDFLRDTAVVKVAGLTDDQARPYPAMARSIGGAD